MDAATLSLLSQPKRERLPNQVADQIRRLILTRQIKVNEKMPSERALAKALGVSPVIIRTALQSLEQAGLVEIRHGRMGGSYVTDNLFKPFSDSIYDLFMDGSLSLQHFFETRSHIERQSVILAIRMVTDEDIAHLRQINAELKRPKTDIRLPDNNLQFHVALSEIGKNPLVKLMVSALLNMMTIIYPGDNQTDDFIQETYRRHHAIIKALEKQDADLAEEQITRDIEMTQRLRIVPSAEFSTESN